MAEMLSGIPVVRSAAAVRAVLGAWQRQGETVALVPTMGSLHDGHLALVRQGRTLAARCCASIFVNPKQFGPREDFATYPRDEAGDAAKLATVGCDLIYAPTPAAMYPDGFATAITVSGVSEGLCGAVRPHFFRGVATVVAKLLIQTMPDVAVFGEKDYQQLLVIRRLVRDLDLPVRIDGLPTVREADGLALSSRNAYLDPAERAVAPVLHRTLRDAARAVLAGTSRFPAIAEAAMATLAAAGFRQVDYFELRDAGDLTPLTEATGPARILTAAWLGRARLIDNVPVL